MAKKAKAVSQVEWRYYPEAVNQVTGCKVGWRFYRDEDLAKTCSEAARHNAKIQQAAGYDFGYCSPGSIERTNDGMFKVCIP